MAEDNRIEELARIRKQEEANNAKTIRLEEQLNAAKKLLKGLVDEIVALGYDPKTFESEFSKLDAKFSEELARYKADVEAQTAEIKKIEESL